MSHGLETGVLGRDASIEICCIVRKSGVGNRSVSLIRVGGRRWGVEMGLFELRNGTQAP